MNTKPIELTLPVSDAQVYGETDEHIIWLDQYSGIHRDMANAWQELVNAAKQAGFELAIASAFRSMQRQQTIWERKLAGLAPVYDDHGEPIDIKQYDAMAQAYAIMRWSALPGASRHHWGTDLDFFDRAAIPEGYTLQLTSDEYTGQGFFAPLCAWLRDYLQQEGSPDFFFPYDNDYGGVAIEPWHLSYRPIANVYKQQWQTVGCCQALQKWSHPNAQVLINAIDALYDRYIEPSLMIPHVS